MRDDQVLMVIKKELSHWESVSLLRNTQAKMRLDSVQEVLSHPFKNAFFTVFYLDNEYVQKRIDEVYTEKAKEFNEKLQANLTREKLKI